MPALQKTFATDLGYDANFWIVKGAQWDAVAQVFDLTLFGYEDSTKAVEGKSPLLVKNVRLSGDTYPITDLTLQDGSQDRGILYTNIFLKLISLVDWADAIYIP